MSAHWYKYPTPDEAAAACAKCMLARLEEALAGPGSATVAVSGGSTPKLLFQHLAASDFRWDRTHVFWVDERAVPPTDPQSNYKLAEDYLLKPAKVPHRNVHRIHAELRPEKAAKLYVEELIEFFELTPGEFPHFDVIHRGMGADGHTASLFPGEPLINDREGLAAAVYVEKLKQFRITLLPAVLLAARHTVMLVAGEDKAIPVKETFEGPYDPLHHPCQLVSHHGRNVTWFFDEAAASLLGD